MANPKKTARTLLAANKKNGVSWRKMARHGYANEQIMILPGCSHGVIYKFAQSRGKWIPRDIELQKKLGIYDRPKLLDDMTINELRVALRVLRSLDNEIQLALEEKARQS